MAKNPAAVALGRRGGKAYVENSTSEQRRAAAQKAANARWAHTKQLVAEIKEGSKRLLDAELKAAKRSKVKKAAK